jgi:transposase
VKRIRDRVGGLDVHKDSVTACARVVDGNGEVFEELERFSTTVSGVVKLGQWLLDRQLSTVAMEATGVYWKPVVRHEALIDREGVKGPLLWAVAAAC